MIINLCAQKLRYQCYFQFRIDWIQALITFNVKAGIYKGVSLVDPKKLFGEWMEVTCYGLFFDVQLLGLRIGFYLHPFVKQNKRI